MATYQTAHIILFDEQKSIRENLDKDDVIHTDQVNIAMIRAILDTNKINYTITRSKDEVADVDDDLITIM
ncbi:hypothetical protein GS399_04370 [Pedobacter sp. HMF7647]|uniref:Uncharacterized protein n=1 Tax=Hufsiella arboris TaxID=2695275 RepID=A0A7K1Y6J6_9SPHI|nr:hypothetical protein [Hufsiella arboris]MXV50195.1 hypothetical protein [Hufsiella arboris]